MLVRFLMVMVFLLTVVCTAAVTTLVLGDKDKGGGQAGIVESGGKLDVAAVELIIDSYLKENPEAIVTAFQEAQEAREEKSNIEAEKAIKTKRDDLENDPLSPSIGSANADVTIVKFSDYNCGYCKRVLPDLIKVIAEDDKVRLVMKDFPILGPQSVKNAQAALAVHSIAKDKWWVFHTQMLKTTPRNEDQILAVAEKVGIDGETLKEEMAKPKYQNQLQKNLTLGQSIGVRGTPAFVINGEFVRGAVGIDVLRQKIQDARNKKKS